MVKLEVPVFSIDSALIAQSAGADRLELCSGFPEGGTTPSYATIKLAKELISIPVNIMIRPRGGDFLYSEMEFEIMKSDIEYCKGIGVNGVVFGILNPDGSVDKSRCEKLVKIAKPISVTFHRAFDRAINPFEAIEDIVEIGFDRILTSGQQTTALLGAELISQLIAKAKDKIIIMPGCGINSKNLLDIRKITGAIEFHASAKKTIPSGMNYNNNIFIGADGGIEHFTISANHEEISKLKRILNENI